MLVTKKKLENPEYTVAEIKRIAEQYKNDLIQFANFGFFKFYNLVRKLKYIPDPKYQETLSRPKYTINENWQGSRDCDDKTILILAFCNLKKIPTRIVISGIGDKPHHVYPEIYFNKIFVPADATYPNKSVFGKTLYTEKYRKVFT